MSHLGFPDLIQQQILSLYNLPYRHYHNETHLDNMLRWVDPKYGKLNAVLEGVIFHDIVHMNRTTPPGFNESASIAIYASMKNNILGDDFSLDKILDTVEAINATAYHQNDQSGLCDVAQILCDLDMQSFASAEHGTDAENVLKEYMAHGYTYEEVLDGNRKFLEKLLNRKRLYYVFTDWEERARANISARIYSAKHDRLSA